MRRRLRRWHTIEVNVPPNQLRLNYAWDSEGGVRHRGHSLGNKVVRVTGTEHGFGNGADGTYYLHSRLAVFVFFRWTEKDENAIGSLS